MNFEPYIEVDMPCIYINYIGKSQQRKQIFLPLALRRKLIAIVIF